MGEKPETPESNASGTEPGVFDPEVAANPQQFHGPMREASPVTRLEDMALLTRHEDVHGALRSPEVFSSQFDAIQIGQVRPLIPLQIDPPDHVKYRRLLDPLFAPREVAGLEDDVRRLADDLIDDFIEDGHCEFDTQFAIPFPCTVFLRLMGLPHEDLDLFLRFKNNIIRPKAGDLEAQQVIRNATGQEIYAYFEKVIDERQREPRDDLISGFLSAEVDGHSLSRHDVLDICYLFLLAGLDTVTASLGCAMSYLAQHPDRRDALVEDPSLIPGAIEELLRWETPVPAVPRMVMEDTEVDGEALHAGETVMCLLASANTDEGYFDNPEDVDFEREANKHLTFGAGVHRCLGSHLARLEMRVALEALHRRIGDYALADGEAPRYGMGIREVEYLPLLFTPGVRAG